MGQVAGPDGGGKSAASEDDAHGNFGAPHHPLTVFFTVGRMAAAAGCGINVRADHPRVSHILGCANHALGESAASVWLPYSRELTDANHPTYRELESMGVCRVMLLTMTRDDILSA